MTAGRVENFLKIDKQVYVPFYVRPKRSPKFGSGMAALHFFLKECTASSCVS